MPSATVLYRLLLFEGDVHMRAIGGAFDGDKDAAAGIVVLRGNDSADLSGGAAVDTRNRQPRLGQRIRIVAQDMVQLVFGHECKAAALLVFIGGRKSALRIGARILRYPRGCFVGAAADLDRSVGSLH